MINAAIASATTESEWRRRVPLTGSAYALRWERVKPER
jgi:hypothetical protein